MSKDYKVQFLDRTTPPHISTLILLAGLSALTMNIFLPSLPRMTTYFQTDYAVMQLSVASYLGMSALLQIIIGPVSDKFGRRPVLLWGVSLFLVATLGCIFAPTIEIFLAARMAQASIVVATVLSRAAIRDVVPTNQAASMIGYVTMGMAVVPMVGPAFGGVLDEAFGWKANFWILLILGISILALTFADLGETKQPSNHSLFRQFQEYPELLTSQRFWGYSLATACSSGAFFAYLGGAPFVATEVFGMAPAKMGFYFGAPALGYFVGNFLSGRYSSRFGVNKMVLWGSIINAVGIALSLFFVLAHAGTPESFFGFMTLVGIGNGMAIPNATAGALSVRPHLAGTASGLSGAIMLGGGAGLSALAGALLAPGSGANPLIWLMFITSIAAIIAIWWVIHRERWLANSDLQS